MNDLDKKEEKPKVEPKKEEEHKEMRIQIISNTSGEEGGSEEGIMINGIYFLHFDSLYIPVSYITNFE